MQRLRTAMEGDDAEAIKQASEELMQAFTQSGRSHVPASKPRTPGLRRLRSIPGRLLAVLTAAKK